MFGVIHRPVYRPIFKPVYGAGEIEEGLLTEGAILYTTPVIDSIGESGITLISPCGTSDGSTTYISLATIAGDETVTNDGTATPSIEVGKINFTSGTVFNVQLSNGITIPVCEGAGSKAYGYDSVGNVYIGTISTADIYAFWDETQEDYHYSWDSGFSERENTVLYSNDLTNALWVKTASATALLDAAGLDGLPNTASTITDANASGYSDIKQTVALGLSSKTHTFVVWFEKDSDVTRFPGIQVSYAGGTPKSGSLNFNTLTGEITLVAGGILTECVSDGNFWRVSVSLADNGTNTSHFLKIWPAVGTSSTSQNADAVGSCVIANTEIHPNSSIDDIALRLPTITTNMSLYGKQPANPITGNDVLGFSLQYQSRSFRAAQFNLIYTAELAAIDDGMFFTGTDSNTISYKDLIKLRGPKWFFAESKGLAAYGVDQLGSALTKIKRWFSVPSYLLAGTVLYIDFDSGQFFWRDKAQSLADIQTRSGLSFLDYGFDFNGVTTLVIDYEINQEGTPSGVLLTWNNGSPAGSRIEVAPYDNGIDMGLRAYVNPNSVGAGQYGTIQLSSITGETATEAGEGVHRLVLQLNNSDFMEYQPDNGDYRVDTLAIGALAAPARLCLNGVAYAEGAVSSLATDITLRRLSIINKDISTEYKTEIGENGATSPIHLIGDSFLNTYFFRNYLMLLTKDRGYIGYSQDGVGGSSLTEQAVRFANNNTKWRDSTLVIYDGGLDGDGPTAVTAIQSMLSNLNHSRWIYIQSAPNISYTIGTENREVWEASDAVIKDFCGDHYLETLPLIQAAGDGSTEDNAEIAKGLWPLSMRQAIDNFHPSPLGNQFVSNLLYQKLLADGWM